MLFKKKRLLFIFILCFPPLLSLEIAVDKKTVSLSSDFEISLILNKEDLSYRDKISEQILKQFKENSFHLLRLEEKENHLIYEVKALSIGSFLLYIDSFDGKDERVFSESINVGEQEEHSGKNLEEDLKVYILEEKQKVAQRNKLSSQKILESQSSILSEAASNRDFLKNILYFVLGLCVFISLVYFFLKLRKGKGVETEDFMKALWEDLRELEKSLISDHLTPGGFYIKLTDLIRSFLENEMEIKALEMTTPEFLEQVLKEETFDNSNRLMLRSLLEEADLIKFAKKDIVKEDCLLLVEKAREFISRYRPQES
jgi:hypothetical protein